MKQLRGSFLIGLALASLAPMARSQACFGPDNLDGLCCDSVSINLPAFPDWSVQGSAVSWTSCNPDPKQPCSITVTAPVPITCDVYSSNFSAAAGTSIATGTLEMAYSRTWDEVDPAGNLIQVWRFLVVADLDTAPIPFLPADDPSFYYGYVDYARACQVPGPLPAWQSALVLFHNCDRFLHAPGISAMPGAFDPARTHAFVAPDNALQPFDHSAIVPPPGGAPIQGALRDPGDPAAATCRARDRVPQGILNVLANGCVCPGSLTLPPRNAATQLTAFGQCGGGALSLDVTGSGFPWLHLVSTSIGRWMSPAVYPGTESALVYEGPVFWRESCPPQNFVDLQYGAGSRGGWDRQIASPTGIALESMLDLRSNWSVPIPGLIALPIVGTVMPSPFTRHVQYYDLP
ncbi:MAG: hypothetical protein WD226_10950 [Planctomycetota bacterium]